MTENEKLRALLAEAREFVALFHEAGCPADQCEGCAASADMMHRIDAALAEPVDSAKDVAECGRCETLRNLAEPVEPVRDCICTGPWTTGHRHTDFCREFRGMRAECQRQMEYGIKQHEAAQDALRERDEARAHLAAVEKLLPREEYLSDKTLAENLAEWIAALRRDAKERSEFAAAETEHANRWAERAYATEKRCREIGYEAALAQHERDEARAEVEMLRGVGCQTADKADEEPSGPCGVCRKCAYQRGAEAMREAAIRLLEENHASIEADVIRALPVPEDKS